MVPPAVAAKISLRLATRNSGVPPWTLPPFHPQAAPEPYPESSLWTFCPTVNIHPSTSERNHQSDWAVVQFDVEAAFRHCCSAGVLTRVLTLL
jgi:hypothetical protein